MEPLTVDVIMQGVGTLGFPIAAFLLIFWQQQTTLKELTQAISSLQELVKLLLKDSSNEGN